MNGLHFSTRGTLRMMYKAELFIRNTLKAELGKTKNKESKKIYHTNKSWTEMETVIPVL